MFQFFLMPLNLSFGEVLLHDDNETEAIDSIADVTEESDDPIRLAPCFRVQCGHQDALKSELGL